MYLTIAILGIALFSGALAGQTDTPPSREPGARLMLAPSEPLMEQRSSKPNAATPAPQAAEERKVRPAILDLKPSGDQIYLVEEQERDTALDQWRTYRRPRVDRFSKDGESVALQGYDVVSYFEKHAEKGLKELSVEYRGVTWLFAGAEHRKHFIEDPERYLPEYGGFCAYSVSKGYPATADPRVYSIESGKLYLFFDRAVQLVWVQGQGAPISRADRNWPKLHR